MMRKTTITLTTLGVVGLGAFFAWTMRPDDNSVQNQIPKSSHVKGLEYNAMPCAFKVSDTLAFDITDRTTSKLDPAGLLNQIRKGKGQQPQPQRRLDVTARDVEQSIQYRLELTVLAHQNKENAILGGHIKDLRTNGAANIDFTQTPLWMRVNKQCAITAFGWSESKVKQARNQQALLSELSWRLPDSTKRIDTSERNILGQYEAGYVRQPHSNGAIVHKRLRRFERAFASTQKTMHLHVQTSKGQILRGKSPWFDVLDWKWQVRLRPDGIDTGYIKRHVVAKSVPGEPVVMHKDWRDKDIQWGWLLEVPEEDTPNITLTKATVFKNLRGVSFKQAFSSFLLKIRDPNIDFANYTAYLRDWIRQNPEQLPALLAAIKAGQFNERFAKSAVFYALGEAHTPQSRQALMGIFQDPESQWKVNHRLQAGWGMSRDVQFAPQSTKAVLAAMDNTKDMEMNTQVSLLAGAMAKNQQQTHPKQSGQLQARLKQTLDQEGVSGDVLSNALVGLGNAQNADNIQAITQHMDNEDALVRRAAVNAIQHMPLEKTEPIILSQYRKSKDTNQRAGMLDVLIIGYGEKKQRPSAQSLQLAESAFASNTSGQEERDRALVLIALAARHGDAAARAILEHELQQAMAQKPRNYDLINKLGKYLGGTKHK